MICVSINNPSLDRCVVLLKSPGLQMAEIRLDGANLSPEDIRAIFALPVPLIATCRPTANQSDKQRQKILLTAIDGGAAYVDVEMEMEADAKLSILSAARAKGCVTICSYHNYEYTPATEKLEQIIRACVVEVDIVKIACRAHNQKDCSRLLALYNQDFYKYNGERETPLQLVIIGMGEPGKITRVAAPFLGAPFTFAAIEEGQETAPGQLTHHTLDTIYSLLK